MSIPTPTPNADPASHPPRTPNPKLREATAARDALAAALTRAGIQLLAMQQVIPSTAPPPDRRSPRCPSVTDGRRGHPRRCQ